MGEAARRKAAALASEAFPGGKNRCPRCLGTQVVAINASELPVRFYGKELMVCGDCRAAWEPVEESQIWDRSDPMCCTTEPCNNCAFRPGSVEQQNTEDWKKMIADLKAGASFYCHKGVPIDPGGPTGFHYHGDADKRRICRGYLNMIMQHYRVGHD